MASLPLKVRQNLKKNEPNLENHLKRIKAITGEDFSVDVDFAALHQQYNDPNKSEKFGDFFYNEIIANLATLLENKLKNDAIKEAFVEATSQRKIAISYKENHNSNGWQISFPDGVMLLQFNSYNNSHWLSSYSLEEVIPSPGGMPLAARVSLEKHRPDLEKALTSISKAAGEEFTLDESTVAPLYNLLDDFRKRKFGELLYKSAMDALAKRICKTLSDEMGKEAFMEAVSTRQIAFEINNNIERKWGCKIENGVFVVLHKHVSVSDMDSTWDLEIMDIEKIL